MEPVGRAGEDWFPFEGPLCKLGKGSSGKSRGTARTAELSAATAVWLLEATVVWRPEKPTQGSEKQVRYQQSVKRCLLHVVLGKMCWLLQC